MERVLEWSIKNNCSDIHITENKMCKVRLKGSMTALEEFGVITSENIMCFVEKYMDNKLDEYKEIVQPKSNISIDNSFTFMDRRFRSHIYKGSSGVSFALRLLSDKIPDIHNLCLPDSILKVTHMTSGLFLVVGTTGSGKSTTLASIINEINKTKAHNIITVEDPIEYMYEEIQSRIEQREVGSHVKGFAQAVRDAMREDPDTVLVGELRDLETIQNAVSLAETGHLVLATLHAKSVTDTVDRIVDVFPHEQHDQIKVQLASVLKGVLYQKLVKSSEGKIVPMVELMMVDDIMSNMLKKNTNANALKDYMRSKKEFGSVHIVDNVVWHVLNKRLKLQDVIHYLDDKDMEMAKAILSRHLTNAKK